MLKPYDYQIELSKQGLEILKNNGLVYLAMEERTGKTLTSILICENTKCKKILIVTKLNAIQGWTKTLYKYPHEKNYVVTNYHQVKKIKDKFDIIILDESHNYISKYPKTSGIWKDLKRITLNTPIIYISATPHAQGYQQLFNQFSLSSYSPWKKYKTFYAWFRKYGIPSYIYLYGRQIMQYTRTLSNLILKDVEHLFITKTRIELNFKVEPKDKLHYVELCPDTKKLYNKILKDKILFLDEGELVCDTSMKLRTSLHMVEGGVCKIEDRYIHLPNTEKIDFIKNRFGDNPANVIMFHYIGEGQKLKKHFKNTVLLSSTKYAEGINLYKYNNLIIYSQDFSTARHIQRRARQTNTKRLDPITVHFLLVKNSISEQVYNTVAINKKNFTDTLFKRIEL